MKLNDMQDRLHSSYSFDTRISSPLLIMTICINGLPSLCFSYHLGVVQVNKSVYEFVTFIDFFLFTMVLLAVNRMLGGLTLEGCQQDSELEFFHTWYIKL